MNHTTLLVWEGRWPLTADLDVHVRVFEDGPAAYRLVLEYPPLPVAGEPCDGFDVTAGAGMRWSEVLDYLTRCRMATGWRPTAPPPCAPTAGAEVADPAGSRRRRTLLRPLPRVEASPRARRILPRPTGVRCDGIRWTVPAPEPSGAA